LCICVSGKKLGEVDKNVKAVSARRGQQKRKLQDDLTKNRREQDELQARLRQLEEEDRDLSSQIKRNDQLQATVEMVTIAVR